MISTISHVRTRIGGGSRAECIFLPRETPGNYRWPKQEDIDVRNGAEQGNICGSRSRWRMRERLKVRNRDERRRGWGKKWSSKKEKGAREKEDPMLLQKETRASAGACLAFEWREQDEVKDKRKESKKEKEWKKEGLSCNEGTGFHPAFCFACDSPSMNSRRPFTRLKTSYLRIF